MLSNKGCKGDFKSRLCPSPLNGYTHEATEEENCKFVPKPRVWKLRDDETARLFTCEIAAKNDDVTKVDDIQKKWLLMKETWLKCSKQVCGMTKCPP